MSAPTDDHRPAGDALDPAWEADLRRGQAAEGERGSVDAELAMVRLMRHAAAPPDLSAARADAIWHAVEAEVLPTPWWKRLRVGYPSWLLAGAAAATAAVGLLWYAGGGTMHDAQPAAEAARSADRVLPAAPSRRRAQGSAGGTAVLLAQQFQRLAPLERARVERRLEAIRDDVVVDLLRALEEEAGRKRP